jgi:hypothetical protein
MTELHLFSIVSENKLKTAVNSLVKVQKIVLNKHKSKYKTGIYKRKNTIGPQVTK